MAGLRRRRTARRVTRRVSRKKRTIGKRRRYTRKRTVSNKRILNVSTVKKQDSFLGSGQAATPLVYFDAFGPSIANPASGQLYAWCPTYRTLTGNQGTFYNRRGTTRSYVRGFRENIEFTLSDGSPLQWRRVVIGSNLNVVNTVSYDTANPDVYGRTQTANQSSYFALLEVVMQGANGSDWNNYMTAKLDAKRCTIYYDKTRVIKPTTSGGAIMKFKQWHPINKSMTYDDEETGGTIASSGWMANEPPNHNVYVLDMFRAPTAPTNSPKWSITSTVYWHER